MSEGAVGKLLDEIARLYEINAGLLAACEANLEFQTGTHNSVDEIMELAEKCKRLTAEAIAIAKHRNSPVATPDPSTSEGQA